jgi:hypothetical protein
MTVRGKVPVDLSNGVDKVCNLYRVSIYSNSRVLDHERLEWPYLTWAGFVLTRILVEKGKRRWFGVPMGVLPWYMSWAKGNAKLGHPS